MVTLEITSPLLNTKAILLPILRNKTALAITLCNLLLVQKLTTLNRNKWIITDDKVQF